MDNLTHNGGQLVVGFATPKIVFTHEIEEEMKVNGYAPEQRAAYIAWAISMDQALTRNAEVAFVKITDNYKKPSCKKKRRAEDGQ